MTDANHGGAILASARFNEADALAFVVLALRRNAGAWRAGASPESFLTFEVVDRRVYRATSSRIPSLDTDWMKEYLGDYEWFPFGQTDQLGLDCPEDWDGKYEQRAPIPLDSTGFTRVLRWYPIHYDDPEVPPSEMNIAPIIDVEVRAVEAGDR